MGDCYFKNKSFKLKTSRILKYGFQACLKIVKVKFFITTLSKKKDGNMLDNNSLVYLCM